MAERRNFRIEKSISVGDAIQIVSIIAGIIWLAAVASTKLELLGGELDDLHGKMENVRTDVTKLQTQMEFTMRRIAQP